jgi:hypothetical protein
MHGRWLLRLKGGVEEMDSNLGKCEQWAGKRPFSGPRYCFPLYEKSKCERYGPFKGYNVVFVAGGKMEL